MHTKDSFNRTGCVRKIVSIAPGAYERLSQSHRVRTKDCFNRTGCKRENVSNAPVHTNDGFTLVPGAKRVSRNMPFGCGRANERVRLSPTQCKRNICRSGHKSCVLQPRTPPHLSPTSFPGKDLGLVSPYLNLDCQPLAWHNPLVSYQFLRTCAQCHETLHKCDIVRQ